MPRESYPFAEIEPKWQKVWLDTGLFRCDTSAPLSAGMADTTRPPFYVLNMYPYPNGALHMGHMICYSIGDSIVRYHLMQGENVLTPMGWDSFGLPAENAAIKAQVAPALSTTRNIDKMRQQMIRAGWGYDWNREIACSHPGYYRWTQWLFLQFYKAGLAFKKMAPVNWCSSCQTVLANEQVHDGGCERCGTPVEQRDLEQWFFAMSRYAQRLLDGHKKLEGQWPESVLKMQKEWVGRSEGARLNFTISAPGTPLDGETMPVFTTRPDTTYGVTFMAIAPEHPHVEKLLAGNPRRAELFEVVKRMRKQSAIERTSEESEKEGIPTGHYVVNPFDGSKAEIWVTNYALMHYGTGAVMGVPAHDQRDFLFARTYGIPIKVVIQPKGEALDPDTMLAAYIEDGFQVNSGPFDGLANEEAKAVMTQYAKEHGKGDFTVSYRLRDWLISRQRYWGAPIPILYCAKCGQVPVPEDQLPVLLPDNVEFRPTGESPLARCPEFVNAACPKCGGPARRETDTMDTFVDSSWYFLRYVTPRKEDAAFDPALCNGWLPVHQYVGGHEHSTMHLIYARFFTMVLHDLGHIAFDEPFARLFCQGIVCANAYRADYYCVKETRELVPEDQVIKRGDGTAHRKGDGAPVILDRLWIAPAEVDAEKLVRTSDGHPVRVEMSKMSKSKFNGVSPDELFEKYGADTVHAYILFCGPADQDIVYSDEGVIGVNRFLNRFWDLVTTWTDRLSSADPDSRQPITDNPSLDSDSRGLRRKAHQTLRRVTESFVPPFRFNTAIAGIMELTNEIRDRAPNAQSAAAIEEALSFAVQCLSPFAPHISEELWARLGHRPSIFRNAWPTYDPEVARAEEIEIPIQVNGKLRAKITVDAAIDDESLRAAALADERTQAAIAGKTVRKIIVVPKRLVNIVVG